MSRKCVIYTSVDTDNSGAMNSQYASLRAFAEREGLEVFYVYEEIVSNSQEGRPVMEDCLNFLRFNPELILLVTEISKLGNSVKAAIGTIEKLSKKGTPVYVQDINLWTLFPDGSKNPMSKIFLTVLERGAELERKALLGRLNTGRERAKIRGVRMGRPCGTKMSDEAMLAKYPEVVKFLKKGFSIRTTANVCSVSNSTVQRVKISMTQYSSHHRKSIA